jgi:diguanylate cyclase
MTSGISWIVSALRRPETLAFLPAFTLATFWFGGENALVLIALGLPLIILAVGAAGSQGLYEGEVPGGAKAIKIMDRALQEPSAPGRTTGCVVIQFDNPDLLRDRHGRARQSQLLACCIDRIRGVIRFGDTLHMLEDGSLTVVLAPSYRLDLETMVQIAARIQSVVHQPINLGQDLVYVTCSIGFCQGRHAPVPSGQSLLDAAQIAADEARRHSPGAIRAFSADMARAKANRDALRDGIEQALETGQIQAYFQPQVSTDTGRISGMEALVRWHHPERGCLLPAAFLPAIEGTGLGARLGQVMVSKALSALAAWDRAGYVVPTVAVNFTAHDLSDPQLPDRLRWELDRLDLSSDRLTVEVLETVVATSGKDVIASNIAAMSAMGCGIDLDDFGTGNASITTIRHFALRRLKIDRSFVAKVDQDREQQKLVAAILSLAERLGLETLAEGVETQGEHAMLAQLGCSHVQGYVVARPMPVGEVMAWIDRYTGRLETLPGLDMRAR